MTALTTRQRDMLHLLLESSAPLGAADLAERMQLTPRQVNYGLKGLRSWLAQRNVNLEVTPGVGAGLACSPDQQRALERELTAEANFQLVLSVEQRQQLIALILLVANEPLILYQLQQLAQVSRTTILKDLDAVESWIQSLDLKLERRQNYGVWIQGSEKLQRQALAAFLWGQTSLGQPLTAMTHTQGLVFELDSDAGLLPIVEQANKIIRGWDTTRTFGQVTYAEDQLGGRFTDDAVLYLAMVLAIQTERVKSGKVVDLPELLWSWLRDLEVWATAVQISNHLGRHVHGSWPDSEIAAIAMHILTAPRNERWPGDLEIDQKFTQLIDELVRRAVAAYGLPHLDQDKPLRDGLVIHITPACLRHRFGLWLPTSSPVTTLSEKYPFERDLAFSLAEVIWEQTAVSLPESEINNIAMLLRAAYIRERPNRVQEVVVVCPSGMASAQLLVARLKTRFPRLGIVRVISMRELNRDLLDTAELIITTVPLHGNVADYQGKIIQVHPLLLPEDIEKITQWLA